MSPAERAAHIASIVAAAPPLTPAQASTIRAALGTPAAKRRNAPSRSDGRERSAPRGEWSPPLTTLEQASDTAPLSPRTPQRVGAR